MNNHIEQSIDKGAKFLDGKIADKEKMGVTDVTGVTTNKDGGCSVTSQKKAGVTNVTDQMPEQYECPTFRVFDENMTHKNNKVPAGVWFFYVKEELMLKIRVCSPIYIEAVTFDSQNNNFGRLLRFRTTNNTWRSWAMPMEMLKGGGDELRGELLAMGVEIQPGSKARNLLSTYLQTKPPIKRIQCALQVGWCGNSFVLPDQVIGTESEKVILQSGERGHDEYTQKGTLVGWRENISTLAIGNPILTLAISSAFTGALMKRCNTDSGGIHFIGESSIGKSTAGIVASSVWGGENYRRSWRTTANGLEGAAMLFNDGLLVLDEISECDPRDVGAIVYALGNGRGKQRASRSGNARGVNRWQCFVLSNGETSIPTIMNEGGHRCKAGQAVRLLDLPIERKYGLYDNLHQFNAGNELSDCLIKEATVNYGLAGRDYLEKLTSDKRDFNERLRKIKDSPLFQVEGAQGQHKRAAARFALIGLAGELATEYGITGWPEGEALNAAAEGFGIWCSTRGTGNDEKRQVLDQVTGFIERHGDSRFSEVDNRCDLILRDRAGWWRDDCGTRFYLFTAGGMKEALTGMDLKRSLDVLVSVGALPKPTAAKGERLKQIRIKGKNTKVYEINAERLSGVANES